MQYLNKTFTVALGSKNFEDNYDRIFRKKDIGDRRQELKDESRENKPPVSSNKQN